MVLNLSCPAVSQIWSWGKGRISHSSFHSPSCRATKIVHISIIAIFHCCNVEFAIIAISVNAHILDSGYHASLSVSLISVGICHVLQSVVIVTHCVSNGHSCAPQEGRQYKTFGDISIFKLMKVGRWSEKFCWGCVLKDHIPATWQNVIPNVAPRKGYKIATHLITLPLYEVCQLPHHQHFILLPK